MSWSHSGKGRPSEVAAAAALAYGAATTRFGEPESKVVLAVAGVVEVTLGAMPDTASVDLSSYGSQRQYAGPGHTSEGEGACNQVFVSITYQADAYPAVAPAPAADQQPTGEAAGVQAQGDTGTAAEVADATTQRDV